MRALALALALLLPSWSRAAACTEDVEGSSTPWSMSGLWHIENAGSAACAGAHSGTHAFYFGIDSQCNYDDHQIKDASLTSPPVTITGSGDTNFSFWTKWQVESMDPACYDQLWIEYYNVVSPTGWVLLTEVGPVTDPPSSAPGVGMASVTGYGGVPQWQFVQLDLSAFAGETLQLRFRFLDSACQASNCAGKVCGPPDSDFDNFLGWVVDDISLGCPPAALTLAKSVAPSFAGRGQTLTYSLTAKNLDSSTRSLVVWDTLPQGADFVSATGGPSQSGPLISWSVPALAPGASQSITMLVSVDPSTPYPTDWLNTATGSSSAGGSFQSQAAPAKIRDSTIQISKSATPSTLSSGDQLTFAITLSNFTASVVSEVDLVESYPDGFVEQGEYPAYATARTWEALGLNPGETRVYTLWGFANGFNGEVLTNQVQAFTGRVGGSGGVLQGSASASVNLVEPQVPQLKVIAVYPNPAPSGKAGLPQSAFVVYNASQAMNLSLEAYSVAGEKVRLISFQSASGKGQVEWDLKNDHGNAVASGIYLLRLWQNDSPTGLVVEGWTRLAVKR
jgi:uncharacterized repeat protein (TIGR01451 family)